MFPRPWLRLSPPDSEGDGGWLLDPLTATEAQIADQEYWRSHECELDDSSDPLEYRTLFDNKGFIFNTGETDMCMTHTLKVTHPIGLDRSPTKEQLATLINPTSPSHRHLAAVIRVPPLPYPSLDLLRSIELDPGAEERELAAPRGRFLRTATTLHTRLLDLDSETSCLLYEGFLLKHGLQELLTKTDYLLRQARKLHQDIQDVLYLNDLIWMLKGDLDRVSRRRWPFLIAHIDSFEETNLVV